MARVIFLLKLRQELSFF